jgi:hypothetical protein
MSREEFIAEVKGRVEEHGKVVGAWVRSNMALMVDYEDKSTYTSSLFEEPEQLYTTKDLCTMYQEIMDEFFGGVTVKDTCERQDFYVSV